jgi:hypothetical protein
MLLVALAASLFFQAAPASAWMTDSTIFDKVLGSCGDPCIIKYNGGGYTEEFEAAAKAVNSDYKKLVAINGPCYSACAVFADKARGHVCIGPRAVFGFHQIAVVYRNADGTPWMTFPVGGYAGKTIPPNSQDIVDWVNNHGGFPVQGLLLMRAAQASKFWRTCPAGVLR